MSWTLIAAMTISLFAWKETRRLGTGLDNPDVRESAPVVGGIVVLVACAGTLLLTPSRGLWPVLREGTLLGAASIWWLLGLEAVLADQGRIENEWRILPGPLQEHAQEATR